MVKVINNRPSIVVLPNRMRIPPGGSIELSEEKWAQVGGVNIVRSWLKAGVIKVRLPQSAVEPDAAVVPAQDEADPADALQDRNVVEAKVLVNATEDTDLLLAWHSREDRTTLKKAIEARLAALEPEEEDEDLEG